MVARTLAGLLFLFSAEPLFAHGGFHERIDSLTEEVDKNPSDAGLRFELANLHAQHGDLKLALEQLDKIDKLAPGKFLTDLLRGEAYVVASDFKRAKEALDRQLVSHPENGRALLIRARVERQLGQIPACLADYREAFKRTPSPEPDLVQEVSEALASNGFQDEAAQVLAKGIEKLGKIPSLVLRVIELEIATKNFDAALRRVDEAQKEAPRPEPWMARRATILAQAGRVDESRNAWKALAAHLASLPEHDRASRAMKQLEDETRKALEPAQPK